MPCLLCLCLTPPHPTTLSQAVSCLAFSESGGILLSGGDDTMAAAWLMADILDGCAGGGGAVGAAGGWQAQGRVEPLHTWCDSGGGQAEGSAAGQCKERRRVRERRSAPAQR
jgi:hypothetical protein